jgi:hypothetical protein
MLDDIAETITMDFVARLFGEAWEHRRKRLRVTGVAAVVAVVAAAGMFAVFGGSGGGSGGGVGVASSRATSFFDSHKASAVLLSRYRDLLSHRVSLQTLPRNFAEVRLSVGRPGPELGLRFGLDTSDIGEARPFRGTRVWLIPGTTGDCFVERDGPHSGSGQCGPIGHSEFGPGEIGSGPLREEAYGLVPDGIHHITVHLAGGAKLVVPVKDNFYAIRLRIGQKMTSISAITPSGRVITRAMSLPGD